jgi:hypothetical protein
MLFGTRNSAKGQNPTSAFQHFWMVTLPTLGRDLDGRYANSPLKPWFDQLKSRNGPCCSMADGYVVEDADWEAKNGYHRVRVPKASIPKTWSGSMCPTM